ncbi:MBL fold metallo-hydrolase [Prauserella cavernicola]|uniref:MBL fold metallo-hydrolase n=1 Tax=Prauserella cavernicola TaxID=2800127 RepID=A0A934QYK1_9PSEU|nr:MBL fold metallo-hydrolase [Prauserella cavernicola]MBK1789120.1 MBL fold metallo-hydrolase [Prauserella cavernicola]
MRKVWGAMAAGVGAAVVAGTAVAARGVLPSLGGRPVGPYLLDSPQFRDGTFHNAAPPRWLPPGSARAALRELVFGGQQRHPSGPVPLVAPGGATSADGLHLTWFGHASTLVELDGARVLLDPVWSDRASPSRLLGPKRLHPVPHRLTDLPALDAIVISHDHYDHLDMPTVRELVRTQEAPFVVPLGVGAHLRRWKVPEHRIVELDWDGEHEVAGVRLVATAAQHFSGRAFRRNNTLWASWVLAGPHHRVFYSGDTGYFSGFAEIGREHGPFDATLVQIGAYAPSWPDIHMLPEEGVAAHIELDGRLFVPVHWGTFNLSVHGWTEPVDRAWQEAKARGVSMAVPRPGQRLNARAAGTAGTAAPVDPWWQALGTPPH